MTSAPTDVPRVPPGSPTDRAAKAIAEAFDCPYDEAVAVLVAGINSRRPGIAASEEVNE